MALESGRYADALGGKKNLFRFFTVRCGELVAPGGQFGMIMPLSLLGDMSCRRTREFMIGQAALVRADCFPQKDIREKRIFKGAKLSTAIYQFEQGGPASEICLRIFPANSLDDAFEALTVRTSNLGLIDRDGRPIPICDQKSYDLCLRIYRNSSVVQLSDLQWLVIRRGEINQTTYRGFITEKSGHERLLKGVEVGRFEIYGKLSQGERQWFDAKAFKKSRHNNLLATVKRIATQRITGVDDSHRIIATIIDPTTYFADSTNSVHIDGETQYSLEYVLGLLNSTLIQWRFRLTSSNNNVGTNELNALPFRLIDFDNELDRAAHNTITKAVKQIIHQKSSKTSSNATLAQRQITALEARIENTIFDLYGLSAAEREIVRQGSRPRKAVLS